MFSIYTYVVYLLSTGQCLLGLTLSDAAVTLARCGQFCFVLVELYAETCTFESDFTVTARLSGSRYHMYDGVEFHIRNPSE